MRSNRSLLALLAIGALAAISGLAGGCGGNAQSASQARRAPTGTQAQGALTRQRALAFVRAVNLTAADLPGFHPSSKRETRSAAERRLEAELHRCVGAAGFADEIAEAGSRSYEIKRSILQFSESSEVGVAPTPALAAAQLQAFRGAHLRGCFARYLEALLHGHHYNGASVGPVSIASGTPPAPGASGSFGWRITDKFTVDRVGLPVYVDVLGFFLGPARVTLISSGTLQPVPAALQERLYALLLARARAHAL